jgi:uncharacterized protein YqcC (DUF446 family)
MAPKHEVVAQKIEEIVTEMKRIGMWEKEPHPSEDYQFEHPQGADQLFAHWLQYKFIPRVLGTIQTKGDFPARSRVATEAAVEFTGCDEDTSKLLALLREFDALFE